METRSDYTYIAVLDEKTKDQIKQLQNMLSKKFGRSPYMDQWEPHVTISFGNLLNKEELEEVKAKCAELVKSFMPIEIHFTELVFKEKSEAGKNFTSIRLKVQDSIQLNDLSKAVTSIAKDYNIPFDTFSKDHFHVGLGRYEGFIDKDEVKKIVDIEKIGFPVIESFSIYYSMMNNPQPTKAFDVMTFLFSL